MAEAEDPVEGTIGFRKYGRKYLQESDNLTGSNCCPHLQESENSTLSNCCPQDTHIFKNNEESLNLLECFTPPPPDSITPELDSVCLSDWNHKCTRNCKEKPQNRLKPTASPRRTYSANHDPKFVHHSDDCLADYKHHKACKLYLLKLKNKPPTLAPPTSPIGDPVDWSYYHERYCAGPSISGYRVSSAGQYFEALWQEKDPEHMPACNELLDYRKIDVPEQMRKLRLTARSNREKLASEQREFISLVEEMRATDVRHGRALREKAIGRHLEHRLNICESYTGGGVTNNQFGEFLRPADSFHAKKIRKPRIQSSMQLGPQVTVHSYRTLDQIKDMYCNVKSKQNQFYRL